MLPNFKRPRPQQANSVSAPKPLAPRSSVAAHNDRAISLIGAEATIVGDVISKSELRVDGEIEGNITGVRLVIGEQARVTGNVAGEDIVLQGQVMGSVPGLLVPVCNRPAEYKAMSTTKPLFVEQGAFFEGKSVHVADPLAEPAPNLEPAIAVG